MKTRFILNAAIALAALGAMTSCDEYLNQEPMSQVTPEQYFTDASHLEGYCNGLYTSVLPSHSNWSYGIYGNDDATDNMSTLYYADKYVPGKWKTSMTDGNYTFTNINTINYFFDQVLPELEEGKINGDKSLINHYIGEMYFMRAFEYFRMLQRFGDFPIIETCLPDDREVLSEASSRKPRNEVARFILSDLDKAAELMGQQATTRLSKNVALLFKSRVALYEGSWLKNFAGTAFVPGSAEWPGKSKSYNANFAYQAGSIEAEYNWFFDQAMAAAKVVADAAVLVENTGIVPQSGSDIKSIDAANPYLAMFGTEDLSGYGEVLLWRQYSKALGIVHNVPVMAQEGNCGVGTTRSMVESFTTIDGKPIYASDLYMGDETIANVRTNRDPRLFVFLKEPGQKNVLIAGNGDHANPEEKYPAITTSDAEHGYSTGYALRKGNTFDQAHCGNGQGYTACPVFRSVEAMLNYIEACYERKGSIDGDADRYWKAIRARHAGLETDYNVMIANTDMSKEKADWGAYTAGKLVDATLYNIRRERRCELMAEGFRWMDVTRWRSLDQMVNEGYHVEGIHIWNTPMEEWYDAENLKNAISSESISEYLRPHERQGSSEVVDGLKWTMAHYLRPMPIKEMMLTAPDGTTVSDSPIYQNPFWPAEPNLAATK